MRARSLVPLLLFVASACRSEDGARHERPRRTAAPARIETALASLRREETERRQANDFERQPPSSRALGANPVAIVALPRSAEARDAGAPRFAGILRGDSRAVLLDGELRTLASVDAPTSPTALAATPSGTLFVVGPIERRIATYRVRSGDLVTGASIPLPTARVLRAAAADERAVVVADFDGARLFSFAAADYEAHGAETRLAAAPTCRGPIRLALSPRYAGVICLFDHALVVLERDAAGLPGREVARITHDGPFFGFSLLERDGALFVLSGGVEDHPLERRDKVFGYIDSFVWLHRLGDDRRLVELSSTNASALGVVTPKVLVLAGGESGPRATVLGYGSAERLELAWDAPLAVAPPIGAPRVQPLAGTPGCAAAAVDGDGLVCADPLVDGWVTLAAAPVEPVQSATAGQTARSAPPVVHPARPAEPRDPSPRERLGEALFFTTLMAPRASSDGRLSRFTCETCHFEGATDGRVHHSGRGAIRVSTRPLFGLFNDAPHFSRAHDPDLTSVCNNEFEVASRGNPVSPWFSVEVRSFPWVTELGVVEPTLGPLELRRALLEFLARFSHEENPRAVARPLPRFDAGEARGAALFRSRCERCHAARLVADEPDSEVAFARWEGLVLSREGPIVWARGDYEKTGVLPYVDPRGTRIPSLRRLYLKRPYLTRGSSPTLDDVLLHVRYSDGELAHAGAESRADLHALTPPERADLRSFLELL